MEKLNQVVLSLGSNLGDREDYLRRACLAIEEQIGKIEALSSIYDTPPLGFEAEQSFLNMCLRCESALSPTQCLQQIHAIEEAMGRVRVDGTYISRTIDIDIVFYNLLIQKHEDPILPHPSYHLRRFVLLPLNDLDPQMTDPQTNTSVNALLEACPDSSEIQLYKKFPFPLQ